MLEVSRSVSLNSGSSSESAPAGKCYDVVCGDMFAVRGAMNGLTVLTCLNLLNYIDRYVPSAVKELIKSDLNLSDLETSAPFTAFVIVYMCCSPIFGYLADKGWSRKKLLAFGVFVWSVATASAALSNNFATLLFTRALVGIGEAAYATIGPAMITDYFPVVYRTKALSIFYLTIPIGAALGFLLGGVLGDAFGWRYAFVAVGAPGVLFSFLCLYIEEPVPGQSDETFIDSKENVDTIDSWKLLYNDNNFFWNCFATTFVSFASGGMADWFPSYMSRTVGLPLEDASLYIGAMTIFGGLFGVGSGSALCGKLIELNVVPNTEYFVMATSMSFCTLFAFLAFYASNDQYAILLLLFFTQYFLWFYTGPSNTVVAEVPLAIRVRAFAVLLFINHLFGDAPAPLIIGAISDEAGLKFALSLVPFTLILATVGFWRGYFVIEDTKWKSSHPGESSMGAAFKCLTGQVNIFTASSQNDSHALISPTSEGSVQLSSSVSI